MFAKLKKKIVEEEGVGEGELAKKYVPGTAVVQRSPNGSPSRGHRGSTASLSSYGSSSSLSAQASADNKKGNEATGDNVQSELSQRNDQIQRLESKLDEYSALLKESVKGKERLEVALEKQEEANSKRIQEMNEEFQLRRSKMMDKLSLAVQRKEDEMNVHIQSLEKEKTDLHDQLQRLSMDKFKKQEESEDLQGFQVQELAKVKHMFVNSQQELHKCRADMDHVREKLEESNQRAERLSAELSSAQENLTQIRHSRDDLIKQKTSAEGHGTQLELTRKSLEERLHSSTVENQEMQKMMVKLEERLNSSQDDMESLKHENEVHKTQAATKLAESESSVKHLEEKVSMLEQRLQDHSLTDDEQMQAIMAERDALEQKLEVSRRELIDVRSSSADKISSLERQISHLNTKMAEDTEEAIQRQQALDATGRRHREELNQLQSKLADAEQRAQAHLDMVSERDSQIAAQKSDCEKELSATQEQLADVKRQSLDIRKTLQDKIASLESKMTGLSTATDFEKSALEHRLTRLESQNEEYLEKEIEQERHITQLEDERDSLTAALNAKTKECDRLMKQLEGLKERADELAKQTLIANTAAEDSHKEIDRLRKLIEDRDAKTDRMDQEMEELSRRNLELANSVAEQERDTQTRHDEAQGALFQKSETITVLKETISAKDEEIQQHQAKIKDLEESLAAVQAETNGVNEAEDIDKLKSVIEDQDQQLSEKNKTIKMQQQRLTDLKKTLQRELKLQNSTGYDSPEEFTKDRDKGQSSGIGVMGINAMTTQPAGYQATVGPSEGPASSALRSLSAGLNRQDLREVNFQYLRHVVFKFMSSTDSEAKQLLKAVSTLLEFTPHEEKLINKTLEWKTSWFGVRPSPKKTVQVSSLAYR